MRPARTRPSLAVALLLASASVAAASPGDLAVYFGSFDPFHEGHLAVIRGALPDLGVESVLVIPAPDQGKERHVASIADRLAMVRAAGHRYPEVDGPGTDLAGILKAGASDWREQVLGRLYRRLPANGLVQELMGMDRFHDLLEADMIPPPQEPRMVIVVDRPGYPLDLDLLRRRRVAPGKVLFLHPEVVDVASDRLRASIARGEDVFGLVPDVVRKLIEKWKLYR